MRVELEAERVPAAFGEDFKRARVRMITPHHATLEIDARRVRRVDAGARDAARRRAPLRAVEPAVWSPGETVRNGMRVLESKTGEPHFGGAIRNVVSVAVRIKQQVR